MSMISRIIGIRHAVSRGFILQGLLNKKCRIGTTLILSVDDIFNIHSKYVVTYQQRLVGDLLFENARLRYDTIRAPAGEIADPRGQTESGVSICPDDKPVCRISHCCVLMKTSYTTDVRNSILTGMAPAGKDSGRVRQSRPVTLFRHMPPGLL